MDFVPARPRLDRVRDGRRRDRQAEPLERDHRSAPCRALADGGDLEGATEHVGEDLRPVGIGEQARRRSRRQPRRRRARPARPRAGSRPPRARPVRCRAGCVANESPRIAPRRLAFQPSERSPPRKGRKTSPCAAGCTLGETGVADAAQGAGQPGVQVAAVGERTALAEAVRVETVEEEPRPCAAPIRRRRRRGAPRTSRSSPPRVRASCSLLRRSSTRRHRAPAALRRPARRRPARAAAGRPRARRASPRPSRAGSGRRARCRSPSRCSIVPHPRAGAAGSRRRRGSGPPARPRPAGGGSSRASRPGGRSSRCGGGSRPCRAAAARRRGRAR